MAEDTRPASEEGFVPVAPLDELQRRELFNVSVEGATLAVARVDGQLFFFDDTCSHDACSLSGGDLEERCVVCPCHGAMFDVETGEVKCGPATEPIRTFRSQIRDGIVEVQL